MEHTALTLVDWVQLIGGLYWISTMIAWLAFSRKCMVRLEREFKAQGISRVDWDGPGFRVLSYATVILFKTERMNDSNYQFVPVSETRRLATRLDWYLALWLWSSGAGLLLSIAAWSIWS
ncbi:hypothetical protein M0C34_03560 [Agarivorans sp. TSD2052]|uniref:hypothetical protein n=1 Tax=Agarivorans sp. TSD2052 TaxID=2937286 RepID=UPI00200E8BBD|nr:hypothetical protein [Agarivorans sp. TSD2052]UPW19367.1 hypothetical protein M0C34_03560 [Agarivorans sp. TSD2052]